MESRIKSIIVERIVESAPSIISKLLEELAEGRSKSAVKETAEETVATTTKLLNGAKDGAKGGLKAGLVIESLILSYKLLLTYNKYDRRELTKKEFYSQVLKHGSSSTGSVLGGVYSRSSNWYSILPRNWDHCRKCFWWDSGWHFGQFYH